MGGAGQESTLINKKPIQEEVQGWIFFRSSIGTLRAKGKALPTFPTSVSVGPFSKLGDTFQPIENAGCKVFHV